MSISRKNVKDGTRPPAVRKTNAYPGSTNEQITRSRKRATSTRKTTRARKQYRKRNERKLPPSLEEYLKAKQSEVDLYKTVPPSLKPYYKNLAEKYFRNITVSSQNQ